MPAYTECPCGFTELEDETLVDHLNEVFESDDMIGNDGLAHGESEIRTCLCGFVATVLDELDEHLLSVFTPENATGRDGKGCVFLRGTPFMDISVIR
jgi:hypothetical protein